MINTICLWVGRIVVFGLGGIVVVFALVCGCYALWDKVLQYWFFKIKHLFPLWQFSQEQIDEWKKVSAEASPDDWRSFVVIKQKGRFVKWHSPKSQFGCRTEYILVKK